MLLLSLGITPLELLASTGATPRHLDSTWQTDRNYQPWQFAGKKKDPRNKSWHEGVHFEPIFKLDFIFSTLSRIIFLKMVNTCSVPPEQSSVVAKKTIFSSRSKVSYFWFFVIVERSNLNLLNLSERVPNFKWSPPTRQHQNNQIVEESLESKNMPAETFCLQDGWPDSPSTTCLWLFGSTTLEHKAIMRWWTEGTMMELKRTGCQSHTVRMQDVFFKMRSHDFKTFIVYNQN